MKRETQSSYHERMLRVLVFIQEHLDEVLALESLASLACFSPCHFHRIFRGMVGESLHGYVRRLRLERAAHRLKFTNQPVTGIAYEAGYETHEAFTRAFRAMFDDSPTGFRKTHKAIPVKSVPSGVHYLAEGRPTVLESSTRYDRLADAYARMFGEWLPRSGREPRSAPALEFYRNSPVDTPPERLITDVYVPLEDKQ